MHPIKITIISPFPVPASPNQMLIYFLSLKNCLFGMFYINGIIKYGIFCHCPHRISTMFSRSIHAVCSSLWSDGIAIWCITVAHFIPVSVDGHLGCFHFLAVVNNTAVTIRTQVLCGYIRFSQVCLGMGWLGHRLALCFTVWDTTRLFPKAAAPLHFLTTVYEGSDVFDNHTNHFDYSHPGEYEVLSQCGYDLHFLDG